MANIPQNLVPIVENQNLSPMPTQRQSNRIPNFRRDSDIFSIERDNRASRPYNNSLFRNSIFESFHDPTEPEDANSSGLFISLREERSLRDSINIVQNPSEPNLNLSEALSSDDGFYLPNEIPLYHFPEDPTLISPQPTLPMPSVNDSVPGDYSLSLARERIVSENSISNNNDELAETFNPRNLSLFDDIFHRQPFTQLGRRRRLSASALWIRRRAARERTEALRDNQLIQGFRRHSTFRNPFIIDLDSSEANRDRTIGLDIDRLEQNRTYYVHSKVRNLIKYRTIYIIKNILSNSILQI